jgi:hypothetical protein
MLARYQIVRGKRPQSSPLPNGRRIDTRKHTRHFLRPEAASVEALIENPDARSFARFAKEYRATLTARFAADRRLFDALAELAAREDVYIGCNCPTSFNPDVGRCHTTLALEFMTQRYPKLEVQMPVARRGKMPARARVKPA